MIDEIIVHIEIISPEFSAAKYLYKSLECPHHH